MRNARVPLATIWLCAILLAACATPTPLTAPSIPTPQTIRIQYPPDLRPLLPALSICLQDYPQLAPQMAERPPSQLALSQADLTLWRGEAQTGFALPLGYDDLQIVVSSQSTLREQTPFQVAALYRGQAPPEGPSDPTSPQVWIYPPGDPIRQVFESALLDGAPVTTQAHLAPHPEAMVQAISADPQAIGLLPGLWMTDTLRALDVPLPPQVILLRSEAEPQGTLRNLAACWQKTAASLFAAPP